MSQIQIIKDATDIVQVIGERLKLQRAGTYFKAPCPFHSEKTPSFFVSSSMQRYKCFGCGESGDVFSFLEKYEGMSFYEALESLAQAAGIKLESFKPTREDEENQQLLEVLNLAKEYYHFLLIKHRVGESARAYLKGRGVSLASINLFQLGAAPNSWDGLVKYLYFKKKYSYEILLKAGLVVHKAGRYYDRFRNRVIFPLKNHRGQVVGFSGRTLEADIKSAKYINSPETALYHKKNMLYGYSELLQEIRKAEEVIVVEGEVDVISSSQVHVNNIVAIKGSALTIEHAKLIKRVADKVILALDTDQAGIEATKRAVPIVQAENLELRVLQVPGAKDVDELIQQNSDEWRNLSKTSISVYEFFLSSVLKKYEAQKPEGRRKIIDELAPLFNQITHSVERDFYIGKLSKALGVREVAVRTDIQKFGKIKDQRSKIKNTTNISKIDSKKLDKREKLERWVIFLLFNGPAFAEPACRRGRASTGKGPKIKDEELGELEFETPELKQIMATAVKLGSFGENMLSNLIKNLPSDLQEYLFEIVSDPEQINLLDKTKIQEELKKAVEQLKQLRIKAQIEEISQELEKLEQQVELDGTAADRQAELLRRIVELRKK